MSFYNSELRDFIRGICKDHLDRCFNKPLTLKCLDDDVLNKYLRLIMEMKNEGFLNVDTDFIVRDFIIWLRSGSNEDLQMIVDQMRIAFLDKFEPIMTKFLDEEMQCVLIERECDERLEYGCTQIMDKETGEKTWSKPIYAHIFQD